MKRMRKLLSILLVVGVAAGGVAVWKAVKKGTGNFLTGKRHAKSSQSPSAQKVREKAVYYCPMHPTFTSDRPGECAICNMKLVKRETAAGEAPEKKAPEPKEVCVLHNCTMIREGAPCPMLIVAKGGKPATCPVCGTHVPEAGPGQERKILYWTDPMMPGFKSDKPGKSPMGMDLVPVYEEAASEAAPGGASPEGYAPVKLTSQRRQLIGVTTTQIQRRSIIKTIRTVGKIAYDPELYQAEEEYLQSFKAAELAQNGANAELLQRSRQLLESSRMKLRLQGLSDPLIDEMAAWKGADQTLLLAGPGGRVWLYAPVYEFELPWVSVGQSVTVEIPSVPGKVLEGAIRSIDPILDPATRSARIRAVLSDPDGMLKPEMFVNASIRVMVRDVTAVPEEAVFDTGTRRIIFVDKGEGFFEPREVVLGIKADGYYELKQGVAEGEVVVKSGNFLIDSESRLKAALEGMSGSEKHQHGQ